MLLEKCWLSVRVLPSGDSVHLETIVNSLSWNFPLVSMTSVSPSHFAVLLD